MAITKLNSQAIPPDTIVESDLSYPLTNFSATGIDDNATSTALTVTDSGIAATLTTATQPNVTSVGTLSALSVAGDLTVDTNVLKVDTVNNRVGVGTQSPTALLDVAASLNPTIRLKAGLVGNDPSFDDQYMGGVEWFTNDTSGIGAHIGASIRAFSEATGTSTTPSYALIFSTSLANTVESEAMRITRQGKVGIGTDDPFSNLSVVGATGAGYQQVKVRQTDTAADQRTGIMFAEHATGTQGFGIGGFGSATTNRLFIGGGANGMDAATEIIFATAASVGTNIGTEAMCVSPSGNVGIGELDPAAKLEVNGDVHVTGSGGTKLLVENTAPKITLRDTSVVGAESDEFIIRSTAGQSSGDYEFVLNNDLTSSTDLVVMKFSGAGNAGIGVTDPDEKLEIGGDIKVTTNSNAGVIHFGPTSDLTKIIGRDTGHATLPNTLDLYVNSAVASRLSERNASFGGTYTINHTVDTSYAVVTGAAYGAMMSGDDGGRGLFGTNVTTTNANVPVIANTHGAYGGIGLDFSWGIAQIVRKGGSVTAGDTLDTVVRFDEHGLKFGSDTAAANALDDYEEGSWPVTLSDGTTTSGTLVTGRYTKIGQVVIARFDALNNINPTGFVGGSNVRISLPFTAGSTGRSTGSVIVDGIDRGSRTQVNSKVSDSAAFANIVKSGSNLNDVAVNWSDINSASYVNDIVDFCIVYTV